MTQEELKNIIGTDEFPNNTNAFYNMVETLADQNITAVKSANTIDDGFYYYDVQNGKVIQEAIIKMAERQIFNPNASDRTPLDPEVLVKYFSDWKKGQYQTTIRKDDIRAIIANKGVGVEDMVSQILSTLTAGESYDDFKFERDLLLNAPTVNYRTILGGVPKTMKGVLYAARDMYNHLKSNNDDLTGEAFTSSTPAEDIRIAISTKMLNLIDVIELAQVFNLTKEELFGKLVVVDVDDLQECAQWYRIVVYDRKAMGKARRLYEYGQEVVEKGRYQNHYLTTETMYFYNKLFKACFIDCSEAATNARKDVVVAPKTFSIARNLIHCKTDKADPTVVFNEAYTSKITADPGFTLIGAAVDITMGGVDAKSNYSNGTLTISSVTGDLNINITAVPEARRK